MATKTVTIVGAGSLRCGPAVLSSVFAPRFEHPFELRLFDANLERLDLVTRLAGRMLDVTRTDHLIQTYVHLGESLRDADAVVVTLYEDCARRMTGKTSARLMLPSEPVDTDPGRGDINRPTPFDELSPMTLAALSTPNEGPDDRDSVVARALDLVAEGLGSKDVLNLTRRASLPRSLPHRELSWPEPLPPGTHTSWPHRILRWIDGDHELDAFLDAYRESPVARWLIEDVGAL